MESKTREKRGCEKKKQAEAKKGAACPSPVSHAPATARLVPVADTSSFGVNVGFCETFRAKIGYKLPLKSFKVFKKRKFIVYTLESSEVLSREQTQQEMTHKKCLLYIRNAYYLLPTLMTTSFGAMLAWLRKHLARVRAQFLFISTPPHRNLLFT